TYEDYDIIRCFGVGFYAAFMVADTVKVVSRAFGSDEAYEWVSEGADGYTIANTSKQETGKEVTIKLKEETEDEKYSDFLEEGQLKEIIKKYPNLIRNPIKMNERKSKQKK